MDTNKIPFCLSFDHEYISADTQQIDNNTISITYECLNCDYSFYDYMELSEYEQL